MCGVKFPETNLDGSGVNVSRTVSRRLERGLEKSLGLAYIIGFIVGCIVQFVGIPYLIYRIFKWRGKAGTGKAVGWTVGVTLFVLWLVGVLF
jgi:uncharacterized membrane protein